MAFELTLKNSGEIINAQALNEVLCCNDFTEEYDMVFSEADAKELITTRAIALQANGRIEFGGGVIDKIVRAFFRSGYLNKENYVQTINELVDIFYFYKNEMMDIVGDDELIALMAECFNGNCEGSLELLKGRELDELAREIRKNLKISSEN